MSSMTRAEDAYHGISVDGLGVLTTGAKGGNNYAGQHTGSEPLDASAAVCTICLDSTVPPIQCGCACRNDSGLAHLECLVRKADFQAVHRGSAAWLTCQTCTQNFTGAMKSGLADAWWSRVCDQPRGSSERLFVMVYVADCRCSEGARELALQMNLEAYVEMRDVYGEEHLDTLQCAHHLAQKLSSCGEYKLAEEFERKVHGLRCKLLGPEHEDALESAEHLALTLAHAKKLKEAEAILRLVLDTRIERLGVEHPSTMSCQNRLAGVLSHNGGNREAQQLLLAGLALQRRVLGAEHPVTLASANYLARMRDRWRISRR